MPPKADGTELVFTHNAERLATNGATPNGSMGKGSGSKPLQGRSTATAPFKGFQYLGCGTNAQWVALSMITLFMGIQWSAFPSRRTIHWASIRTKVPSATLGAAKPVMMFEVPAVTGFGSEIEIMDTTQCFPIGMGTSLSTGRPDGSAMAAGVIEAIKSNGIAARTSSSDDIFMMVFGLGKRADNHGNGYAGTPQGGTIGA
jgi:hypothetical protein